MVQAREFFDGFFDGFGPLGLFFSLQRAGAPTQVFGDETPENSAAPLVIDLSAAVEVTGSPLCYHFPDGSTVRKRDPVSGVDIAAAVDRSRSHSR
jgi:hypothetical protein